MIEKVFMDSLDKLFKTESDKLFLKAREASRGNKTILSAASVINGLCRIKPPCRHCQWRRFKAERRDFAKKRELREVVTRAAELERQGINRICLPSGWMGYTLPNRYYAYVKALKNTVKSEIYGLFGAINKYSLSKLKDSGMDGYRCGLESPNNEIYKRFRPGGDTLERRIETLYNMKELGLMVWTGFIYGLGESENDVKSALRLFKILHVDSVSILPFEPFPDTDMYACDPPNPHAWARVIAITRIFLGGAVNIFTNFSNQSYYSFGLHAGANGFHVTPD